MMRSLLVVALCMFTAAAQSSVTLLNLFQDQSTLTQIGADATATTYINSCAPDKAGISALPSDSRPTPDSVSASAGTTPKAHLARQARSTVTASAPTASASNNDDDDDDEDGVCEPFTLKQGPSTWEFHLKDPTPGAWTLDMGCNWKGAITSADLICTITQSGSVPDSSDLGISTTIFSQQDIQSMEALQAVVIVTASPTPSGPSRPASTSGSLSASRTASAGSAKSTGIAPSKPLPTGGLMFVGGAGVVAAALAL